MARKRKGDIINGWIIIDKPLEIGSTKIVSIVKRMMYAQKVGHGGTLDPLASGILPIGLGEATKTMPYVVDSSKDYDFTVKWGSQTDSDDLEGAIIHSGGSIPSDEEIESILPAFMGTIEQTPPAYSAIKVDGRRAYDMARAGEDVVLKSRLVEIQSLRVVSHDHDTGETTFTVTCGKGTYVRSLGRDMAIALGTYGHITKLRRTRVGPFTLDRAISLEKLEDLGHKGRAAELLLPVTTALDDIPVCAVTEEEADLLKHGGQIKLQTANEDVVLLACGDTPIAMASITLGITKILRVFNM
jgi:tRNA pseudouridine55 synthase